jgi:hypothetical protein
VGVAVFFHHINSDIFFATYVINQCLQRLRQYNINKKEYDFFVGKIREDKLNELKLGLNKQQNMLNLLVNKVNESKLYVV